MKVCDRCESVVHDLESYKKPDGTRFDLCFNCELDHSKLKQENQTKFDVLRNAEYEDQLKGFMMERPIKETDTDNG